MFGKIMSVTDQLMWRYYLLLTDLSQADVDRLQKQVTDGTLHPKQAKVDLAQAHRRGISFAGRADTAAAAFEARFTRGETRRRLAE
jgi:tyrosyl-tRNA synthetase